MAKAKNEGLSGFLKRSMTGSTFLTLEHSMHMVLYVLVPGLVAAGILAGLQLWFGQPPVGALGGAMQVTALMSVVGVVATLVVLSPFLVILDKRTRAEWVKRPGFQSSLSYRVPIYVALAAVWLIKLAAIVALVWVLLYGLAGMGNINPEALAAIYNDRLVPALVVLGVYVVVGWFLIRLAQGHDFGRKFNLALLGVALALAAALYITAISAMQNPKTFQNTTPSLEDYLKDLDTKQLY